MVPDPRDSSGADDAGSDDDAGDAAPAASRDGDPGVRIRNRDSLGGTPARETALACVEAGIEAVLPGRVVPDTVRLSGDRLVIRDETSDEPGVSHDLSAHDEALLLGGGKAAARVARALEGVLGDRLDGGVVVTDAPVETDRVAVHRAAHPVPDERGVAGAGRVLERARAADADTLALVTVTGGASALLPAPAGGIDLPSLRAVTDGLLDSGAPIADINAVRKHCSRIKGGLLARELAPATVVALAVSDVVGDDPSVIGSGPTVGDPTTYADALDALERHGVDPPPAVEDHLRAGAAGDRPETPAPGDPAVERAGYHLLATNRTALAAARRAADRRGYRTLVLSSRVRGEAREAAKTHAAVAEEVLAGGDPLDPPAVVLSGGETTVAVTGEGRGGPSAEFALSAAVEFATRAGGVDVGDRVAVASVDTDGRDGPGGGDPDGEPGEGSENATPAGALVDGTTVDDPGAARGALRDNDAHGYLAGRGAVVTGATGTNVNDLRVVVVADPGSG